MIKVRLSAPRGVGPDGSGFDLDIEMPAVPRVDEDIALGNGDEERTYRVHGVHWYPGPADPFDVYIVLRD